MAGARLGVGRLVIKKSPLKAEKAGRGLYLAASSSLSVLNLVFHLVYSRYLGPDDYSALGALLGVVVVLAVPIGALQVATAHAAAGAGSEPFALGHLLYRTTRTASVVLVLLGLASPWMAHYLHLDSPWPLVLVAAWIWFATISAVPIGMLVGQMRFGRAAWSLLLGFGITRMLLAGGLVEAKAGIVGAMVATAAGQAVSLFLLLSAVRAEIVDDGHPQLRLPSGEGWLTTSAVTSLAVLDIVDTVLARRIMAPADAGYYAAAATAGRVALFAPAAIATIVFPQFVRSARSRVPARRLMVRSAAAVAGIGGVAVLVMACAPGLTIRLLFGSDYSPARGELVELAVSGALLGVLTLLTYFHLANSSAWALVGWLGSVAVVVAARRTGLSPKGMADVVLVVAVACTAISVFGALVLPGWGSLTPSTADAEPDVVTGPVVGPVGSIPVADADDVPDA